LRAGPVDAPVSSVPGQGPDDSRTARARRHLAPFISIAFRLYSALKLRRSKFLWLAARASSLIERRVVASPCAARYLDLAASQFAAGRPAIGRAMTRAALLVLAVASQIHLAASRKTDALRAARLINLMARDQVRRRQGWACGTYFGTLAFCKAYDRIVREVPGMEPVGPFSINFAIGLAKMYRGQLDDAAHYLRAAAATGDSNALRKLGCVHLLMEDEDEAAACFQAAVAREPRSVMAHQNAAARYDPATYEPSAWERENAGQLLIYDNLVQLGEEFCHQGRHSDAFRCYQRALLHQDRLAARWQIPDALIERVSARCPGFRKHLPVRLLGYEWVTLIGHIGSIDGHLRMAALGIVPEANYVLLAPRSKVVNAAFLALWSSHLCIIDDPDLVDALFPYQRLVGDQFMAVRGKGEIAEPWPHAAARAQVRWSAEGRPPLVTVPADLIARGRQRLSAAGVACDWFVALHIREGGYHGDGPGTDRQHRSANVADYLEAIAAITARGGIVIRLGDSSMTPLPGIDGLFDYAHSKLKSEEMDLFLCAEARFFLGTTSGLAGAVQALGTPMLLVNCISSDSQFWHGETDFILRPVYSRTDQRCLSIGETYCDSVQPLLIDGAALRRHGLDVRANAAEDIVAAVNYKLDCLEDPARRLKEDEDLMTRYRHQLRDNPFNFGPGRPVRPFLASHEWLISDRPRPTGPR
jgi:putative glycosyltransferase (TIGR04372 family)